MLSDRSYSDTFDRCPRCGGQMYEFFRVYVNHDPRQGRHTDSVECEECGLYVICKNGKAYPQKGLYARLHNRH